MRKTLQDAVEAGLDAVAPVRCKFGDLAVEQAVSSGVRQVVHLEAGEEARPFQADLRHLDLIADIRGDWAPALVAAGLDPTKPVHWVAEGLFYFLSAAERDVLVHAVTDMSAPGSSFVLDIPHDRFLADPDRQDFLQAMRNRGAPLLGSVGDPWAWLSPHGWVTEAYRHTDLAGGRCPWMPPITVRPRAPHDIWFVRGYLA